MLRSITVLTAGAALLATAGCSSNPDSEDTSTASTPAESAETASDITEDSGAAAPTTIQAAEQANDDVSCRAIPTDLVTSTLEVIGLEIFENSLTDVGTDVPGGGTVVRSCTYQHGDAGGRIVGFNVQKHDEATAAVIEEAASTIGGEDGVSIFPVELADAAAGFTIDVPGAAMSRVEIATGNHVVSVTVTGDEATSPEKMTALAEGVMDNLNQE